jgi:dinuclear metal center YbgI/SA1388 family protein
MALDVLQLQSELDSLLNPGAFRDYCPNGLQVEGTREIKKLVTGVTASQALIKAAIENDADALLVHHGYFWRGEDPAIVGLKRARVNLLLENNVSLFAYHLPLDAHPDLGNNTQLAKLLGFKVADQTGPQGETPLVWLGETSNTLSANSLAEHLQSKLGRKPVWVSGGDREVSKVAWCTGAAQNFFEIAVASGVDAYITGEISEPSAHIAREAGVHFYAAGHHATERYGVQAVGLHLADQFGIEHQFIEIDNPA